MTALLPCSGIFGGVDLIESDPQCRVVEDAYLFPKSIYDTSCGVFDRAGHLVIESGDCRGVPTRHLVWGTLFQNVSDTSFELAEDGYDYVYLGRSNHHYGHFLLGILARLWNVRALLRPRTRFILDETASGDEMFRTPFVATILKTLGLTPSNFIHFDRPTRVVRLIVPGTAFEENSLVHRVYGDLCQTLGAALSRSRPRLPATRPVYLSKERLRSGISRIVNENLLTDRLRGAQIEIMFPEAMSFLDQLALFRDRPLICGTIGSAFHTSVFFPGRSLLMVNHGASVWSNQLLLDRVSSARSSYCYPAGLEKLQGDQNFGNNFLLTDPISVADEMIALVEAKLRGTLSPTFDHTA